ncbi:hypothetical protein GCM10009104_11790 [Marinobacterium maritimum]|uniref:Uncharacterized protein n=1 Tax=Marinobacterium maritimum TaxID=500162 RepID=A0ABN1I452_9GAMM
MFDVSVVLKASHTGLEYGKEGTEPANARASRAAAGSITAGSRKAVMAGQNPCH